MTDAQHPGPTLAELARRMQEMYVRFEAIAIKMETSYVTKELYELNNRYLEELVGRNKEYSDNLRRQSEEDIKLLRTSIDELNDDKKWLVRLVFGAIILTVLGTILIGTKAMSQ